MGIIKELDIQLANKIAAGEVVERPASVIKELVENALDAGSTQITVAVDEVGLRKMVVTDNGSGIVEEDMTLAFHRHATSKIHNNHDLFHIRTLGFRGEALASIASVSKVTLKSCADGVTGHLIRVENNEVIEKTLSKAKQGTEITVEALFYNTPARLKYVKSLHTELGKITDIMNRFAMSHPEVRFTLISDDKNILQTTGNGRLDEVMATVYGIKIARDLVEINGETGDYKVSGMIARPLHARANRHYISLFINGRYIKNFMLTKAIMAGYHTLLPIGRYPVVSIHIDMDPGLVDVNVHPTKQEVRLSKEADLMALIETLIKQSLMGQSLIPHVELPKKNKVLEKFEQQKFSYDQAKLFDANQQTEPLLNEEIIREPVMDFVQPVSELSFEQQADSSLYTAASHRTEQFDKNQEEEVINTSQAATEQTRNLPFMEIVGQVHGTYIIAQNEEGMFMIDQHAAQERIKYEFFKHRIGQVANELQPLLIPLTLNFTKDEAIKIEKYVDELQSIGIELENFGGNDYIVQAIPTWFPADAEEVIKDIIDYCLTHQSIDLNKFREDTAIMMSCKKSIKANHYLRKEDMARLVEQLSETNEPYTCPHGRPITIQLTTYDLEKLFKRVM